MASQTSDLVRPSAGPIRPTVLGNRPITAKIVVAGGSGTGKTTLIGSVSQIEPVGGEMSMDVGRVAFSPNLWLYLFGTPLPDRFGFVWDDLVHGAVGAVVLVDTARMHLSFPAVDYFESRRIPFVVAVNCFDGVARYQLDDVRAALSVPAPVPVLQTDARSRAATKRVLAVLVQLASGRAGG